MEPKYSSVGRRFVALFIDGCFLLVCGLFLGMVIPFVGQIVIWFFYGPILESSALKATIGKKLMGLQVTDLAGQRLSLKTSVIRNLMKIVSGSIVCIGYLFAFFSSRKQALHDFVAETVVVDGVSDVSIADAWVEEVKALFSGFSSAPSSVVSSNSVDPHVDISTQLERVKAMRDRGELSEAEYEAAKRKILQP